MSTLNRAITQKAPGMAKRIVSLYVEGFRSMTIGRSLWILILVKLFLLFAVLKLFFFPNILEENYDNDHDRAEAVRTALIKSEL